ncbi:uncharacterized protein LOC112194950 [Rosa chinensis]|uniref:uncharacterized protein LOC112194950 n=1 Tax=Rosa chinensis TaxID=74649 RepID=UPI001AD8A40A|nr:uncharacterized protein LOC112194950 [Rosa chinensis]
MADDKADAGSNVMPIMLNGNDNFTLWQRKMKSVLILQGLYKAILGIENKAADMADKVWQKMDKKAKSFIELHLADHVLVHVLASAGENMNSKETWDYLEKVYASKVHIGENMDSSKTLDNVKEVDADKLFLKDELYSLRMEEGGDLQDHLNNFQICVANLSKVDVRYKDEEKTLMLLRSLPASFKHFITRLVSGKDSLKYDEITEAIQSYFKMSRETKSSQGGLHVKGNETGQLTSKKDKSGNRSTSKSKEKYKKGCFKCGATDHLKRNCREGKMKAAAMAGSSNTANVVIKQDKDDGELLVVAASSNAFRNWILDTDCTFHMCAIREWFDTYEESSSGEVFRGDDSPCRILGIGSVKIRMHDGVVRTLENVRYIPKLRKNLISLGTLDKAGYRYRSEEERLKVLKGSLVVMKGDIQPNNLYKLQGTTIIGGVAMSTEVKDKTELWHHRLGHMSQRGMQELHKKGKLEGVSVCKLNFCKDCTLGKQKVAFKLANCENKSKGLLDYIHSDVWGPAPVRSMGGFKYFVTFLDDFSRKIWVCFMREKSEVFTKFKEWKTEVENLTGRKIKYLRSNSGSEYRMKRFLQFCKDEGITRHFTVKENLQQNGAARRMNKTLLERERSMRLHAGLPDTFWADAVNHACYLVNRSPSKVLDFKCAEEVWSGEPADYLRVFGCSAYAHISNNEQTKLRPKSRKCIFLGIEKGVKGYKLWDIVSKKRVLSRHVIFDEETMPFNEVKTIEVKKKTNVVEKATKVPLTKGIMEETPAQVEQIEQVEHDKRVIEEEVLEQQQQSLIQAQVEQLAMRTYDSVRQSLGQEFQRSIALDKYALSFSPEDPTTYQEAIANDVRESWRGAMLEQMKKSIHKDLVQESVPKPKERNQVGCKWVYRKIEVMHDKEAMRFKAWVLAKEYSQKVKVDFDQISPMDSCVYHHVFKDSMGLLLLLYLGDVLTTCQDMSRIPKLKTQLGKEFDIKDLEAAQQILGVKIRRDREAGKIGLLFEPVSTPPVAHFQLSVQRSSTKELDEMMNVSYARVVECLMYARICTRPGLAQALSIMSKYMANPGRRHWQAVKWILYYLRDTKEHEFVFERQQEQACIAGPKGSDLAGDIDKTRPATSYIYTCNEGLVSCRATMESATMLSTTEVDCMALTETSAEALWLNGLMSEFGIQQEAVMKNGVINLTRNQVFQAETKHVDVRSHRREGWVNSRKITNEKVHSRENVSDCLTRTIAMEEFKCYLNLLDLTAC